ncbi:MAG TPA: NAD(P)(+) transhydrogenase (Re/Si-specific) subunit beta [Clostridia bacterium]|nr:NAD(P)(+) transhydrogenase (Re/Si-specific) subunit beta [Clostridia bacterium]
MSNLVYYSLCGVLTLGVLIGIAMMSKVKLAAKGNALSALCTAAAIFVTLYKYEILSDYVLWIVMAAGLIVGLIGAYKVKMIQMPQTVAMLNGFGGAASALVAAVLLMDGREMDVYSIIVAGLAFTIGTVTLTGSLVAGGKLHRLLPQKPIVWKGHQVIVTLTALTTLALIVAMAVVPLSQSVARLSLVLASAIVSGFLGIAFSIRVGGADMPITISLLNSLSGVAGAIAGMAIADPLLVTIGGVVGASGLLLTQIMCRAMNRSLGSILFGKASKPTEKAAPEKKQSPAIAQAPVQEETPVAKEETTPAQLLADAKKVILIPGYGMALAQAQGLVKQLADKLEANGTEVLFAIHPVAGRMPGHMNVLLCEVDVPYEKLYEMDDINPQFADCDVAVIIGANDVVNPAANTAQGTPIYGMPILEAGKAKHLIICNYDLKPGYAGVENPLYTKPQGVTLLLGDAKETLTELLSKF